MASIRKSALLAAASALALTGCGDRGFLAGFTQESGAFLDQGGFGNATMNNTQIQNGDLSHVVNLNNRFNQEVPAAVEFAFNSAALDGKAQVILKRQAHWIRQFPEVRFRVYGHTDLVGSTGYNRQLGQRRANAVVNFLVRHGISRHRLEAVVSYGETQPIIYTEQPEMRNRRAVTEVSGFVKGHPLVLNGKYAQVIFREYVESATELPPDQGTGALTEGN